MARETGIHPSTLGRRLRAEGPFLGCNLPVIAAAFGLSRVVELLPPES